VKFLKDGWIDTPHCEKRVRITQDYSSNHTAVDFNGYGESARGMRIFAGYHGVVVTSKYRVDRGQYVEIRIADGAIVGFCHMMTGKTVKEGVKVKPNTVVGYMCDSGNAQGVHVHYYVVEKGRRVNPKTHLISKSENEIRDELLSKGHYKCTVAGVRVRATPSLKGVIEGQTYVNKVYTFSKTKIADGYLWLYLDEWHTWTAYKNMKTREKHGVIL